MGFVVAVFPLESSWENPHLQFMEPRPEESFFSSFQESFLFFYCLD